MSSMSHQNQKASEAQQQMDTPTVGQQAPEGEVGNQAALEDAGVESQGKAPRAQLDELLDKQECDPFDVAMAYAQMNDRNKVEYMALRSGELEGATQGDPVAWTMIEKSFQTAMASQQEMAREMAEGDTALQDGIEATIEAALADHSEGLWMMAERNFAHEELKYANEVLQMPKKAERSVKVGEHLAMALGTADVNLTIDGSEGNVAFSDLELGSVYSSQTASGAAKVVVTASGHLGLEVSESVHAEAAESVVRQLPGGVMVGAPEFAR